MLKRFEILAMIDDSVIQEIRKFEVGSTVTWNLLWSAAYSAQYSIFAQECRQLVEVQINSSGELKIVRGKLRADMHFSGHPTLMDGDTMELISPLYVEGDRGSHRTVGIVKRIRMATYLIGGGGAGREGWTTSGPLPESVKIDELTRSVESLPGVHLDADGQSSDFLQRILLVNLIIDH